MHSVSSLHKITQMCCTHVTCICICCTNAYAHMHLYSKDTTWFNMIVHTPWQSSWPLSYGAVHKVYHTIFCQFLPPPPVTLCHTSRDLPPKVRHTSRSPIIFSRPSTKPRQNSPVLIVSQLFAGYKFVRGIFPGWFLSIPPSVRIHLLQQKVKHHFTFHISYVWYKFL